MHFTPRITVLIASMLCVIPCFAQDDSTVFINGKWTESRVCRGVTLRQCHFDEGNLFGANEFVSVLVVSRGRRADVINSEAGTLERTTALTSKSGAVAAVNGSFFKMKAPYGANTYVRVDGEQTGVNASSGSTYTRKIKEAGSLALRGRKAEVIKAVSDDPEWEDCISAEDVLSAGPMLLVGGGCDAVENSSFNTARHPRTAAGVRKNGSKVFVVVDGRTNQSAGVSVPELQKIMLWLGCTDAINLDGGGSSAMVVKGEIVNHPCDNGAFDAAGERSVANAVVICAPKSKKK